MTRPGIRSETLAADSPQPITTIAPIAATNCPLCGQPNQCAPAASGTFDNACWCATVNIDPAVLARIAPEQRGKTCVCPRCAAGQGR